MFENISLSSPESLQFAPTIPFIIKRGGYSRHTGIKHSLSQVCSEQKVESPQVTPLVFCCVPDSPTSLHVTILLGSCPVSRQGDQLLHASY